MANYEIRPQGSHAISLERAEEMTALYRENRLAILKPEYQTQDILPLNETFNGADVLALMNQQGCIGFRIYYGMSQDLKVHAILVGVDDKGYDILPTSSTSQKLGEDGEGLILEDSQRCPISCPPDSSLNTNP